MSSTKAVNNLMLNPKLDAEKLKAVIPVYRTICSGIVKDIPQHYNEDDLLKFFDASYKKVEVKRLNRRIRIKDKTKYIPSRLYVSNSQDKFCLNTFFSAALDTKCTRLYLKSRFAFLVIGSDILAKPAEERHGAFLW